MAAARLLLVMTVGLTLDASLVDERGDLFCPPDGCAWAEFDRPGKTADSAALPPCAFADGDDGQNLWQTEKAVSGDGELFL